MKQTNNAIKFLMAQYRAIFKNANIAMFAAMAAAALAAGSANAASGSGASPQKPTNITDWPQITSGTIDGTSGKALAIVAAQGKTESNGFDLTITSGSHSIKGASGASGQSGHHTLTTANGKTTTITLSGDGTAVAQPTLTIGSATQNEHVDVTITNLNNYAGTLSITGQGTNKSSLTATNIQIGGSAPAAEGAAKAAAASKAVVSLGASGEIIAAEGGTFNILSGGELKFAGAASKATANSGIILNGGKISVADSGAGTVAGALTVTDGAVEINGGTQENTLTFENLATFNGGKLDVLSGSASGGKAILKKGLTMNSGTLTVKGGDNANKSGKLEVSGDVAFNSNSKLVVEKNASAKFGGNATFASGTVTNSGTIEALADATINTDGTAGLYSANGKLKLTGATLNFTGAALDLSDAAVNISGDASSTILALADKAAVTVDKAFNKKANSVTASTIVGKTDNFPTDSNAQDFINIVDKNNILLISGGSVTALNELKGDKANSQIVVFNKQSGGSATLTLGKDASSVGNLTNISRVYVGLEAAKAGQEPPNFLNVKGTWDFNRSKLAVGTGATLNIEQGAEVNNVYWLQMHGYTDKAEANIDGTLNVGRLLGSEVNSGESVPNVQIKGSINVTGTLNVVGDGKADGPNDQKKYGNDVQLAYTKLNINAGGTVALATKDAWDDVIDAKTNKDTGLTTFVVKSSGDNTTEFGGWTAKNVDIKAGGTLRIDLSGYKVADKAALDALKNGLMASTSKGLIDFGGLSVDKLVTNPDGSIDLTNMPNVKTEATKNLEVNVGPDSTLSGSYSMGSANVSGDKLTTAEGSTLEFNKAKNGQFATNTAPTGSNSKVNVTLSANSALKLNGNGSLGDIKQSGSGTAVVLGGNKGTQTVGVVDVATFKQVGGNVTTGAITASTDITVNGVLNAGGDISTAALDLTGGAIKAAGKDITVSGSTAAQILGDVEAGTLSLSGGATIAGDADVKLGTLNLAGSKTLNVGRDGENGSTATVFTEQLVMGAGSTIFVDPSYNDHATVLSTKVLTDTKDSGVNVASGKIIVGKNAAFGVGFEQAEFNSVMSNYLVDGKFTDPDKKQGGYANALVLGNSLVIASGNGVTVDHTLDDAAVKAGNATTANTLKLVGSAALIITDKAFGADKTGTAITFGKTGETVTTATVTADASSVISLVGDFDAKDTNLKIFAANNNGTAGTVTVGNVVNVQALGGLLEGKLTSGTLNRLDVSDNAKTLAYAGVSRPVGDFFLGLASGDYVVDSTQAGHKFVTSVVNTAGGFKVVDTAAHAATYAGAQQAAVASVTTMADAMFGRVGAVGVEAASISATGSQANGGVWLAPMYKSVDADGFNAEGASYGSDVDLAGVAFGTDTVNGNMRFGAVFNIGSGDADGKGQGNGLKDEFDYYGFGIYSAMGFGNLALVGDASLTVISHDVEGLGLKGKADTTAVTMGLTGQYTVATPAVDVTPHLGARFIRLNTDSYDLIGADGAIATTDFDVQNVFSVPLGVTLSKAFVAGGWSLAPSADLTVAFNTGDTEAKSTTTFSGIAHGINLNTEVLDEVQYGLTLGLGAQYGAFGTSFGINYTGSENTDSFGVNAQARYMF